jgi:hypothetical protein
MEQSQTAQLNAPEKPKPRGAPWEPGQSGNPSGRTFGKRAQRLYDAMTADFAGVELSAGDRALLESAARLLARRMKSDDNAIRATGQARKIVQFIHERHRQKRVYHRRDEPTSPDSWSPLRSSLDEVTP